MTAVVVALVDETGSMGSRRNETITGYNFYLDSLRDTSDQIFIKTFKFDAYIQEPMVRPLTEDALLVSDAPRLSIHNYTPRGSTPLYDAVGKAIIAAERLADQKGTTRVTLVIQTDGQENASTEYSFERIKMLIAAKKEMGWNILFLAADLGKTGYVMAQGLGVSTANTMSYASFNSVDAFGAAANATRGYGLTGQSTGFSDDEKKKSGDTNG